MVDSPRLADENFIVDGYPYVPGYVNTKDQNYKYVPKYRYMVFSSGRESTADFRPAVGPPAHLRGGCGDLAVCGEVAGGLLADLLPITGRTAGSLAGRLRGLCGSLAQSTGRSER